MLEIRLLNVSKKVMVQEETKWILSSISMDINPGDFITIAGPSGSGKTTLLMMLGKLLTPDSGSLRMYHQSLGKIHKKLTLNEVSFIFQNNFLLPDYTALENILFPFQLKQKITKELTRKACYFMEELGILKLGAKKVSTLSGGEQQVVGFIRGILPQSGLILADEPTSDMDSELSAKAFSMLQKINQENKTSVVLVSHNPESIQYSKEFYRMKEGKMVEHQKLNS